MALVPLVLGIAALVAYILAVYVLVETSRRRNTGLSTGLLWFIGIFTTPVVLALIVMAQPSN